MYKRYRNLTDTRCLWKRTTLVPDRVWSPPPRSSAATAAAAAAVNTVADQSTSSPTMVSEKPLEDQAGSSSAGPLAELYPSESDLPYEEELLRNPFSLKLWWRYLIASARAPFRKRAVIYERAVKALPTSYKLWHAYLSERLAAVAPLPVSHPLYSSLNNTFERAIAFLHKMPVIWSMYLQTLTSQKLITRTRRTFDRALRALPVTQHEKIWELYLVFASQKGVPVETSLRVYRRYLKFDPSHIENLIDFLIESEMWQEAAERLAEVLNDDRFYSIKGKTRHELWLELCELMTRHATEVSGLKVDDIIRGGIRKFSDEVGRLWTSLADYYVRRGQFEKARDVFEEGMTTVVTVRDFGVIFDSYTSFEESALSAKMETLEDESDVENGDEGEEEGDVRLDFGKLAWRVHKLWLEFDNDVDVRLARLNHLIERRPELVNSVLLRQNPHNVEQWHRRVKLFENNPTKQILTYTEAVRTVDHKKAIGKPHTLWVSFARLYEQHNDLDNARVIFDKAVQENFKTVDNLASVYCEWAEIELRHNNVGRALELMRRATAEPSLEVKRRVAADGDAPVQMKLHRSLRLWTFYVDLEESLGTLESTRKVYDKILDLKIATPQIVMNYALLLEENKYFEDAFKVYERGVKVFKYPHVKDIWIAYLTKFIKRYKKSKLERARELFEQAIEQAPAGEVKPLYLMFAKLEEEYGLAKRAMNIYDDAAKAVPDHEKLGVYEIYMQQAVKFYGAIRTREIYEQAIGSGLPDKDVKAMCMKYAELEKSLGDIDRARGIYIYSSQLADPRQDPGFWNTWHEFEVQHGNEDTFREMLRIKRSVQASFTQTHFILPEYLIQKDQKLNLDEAVDALKLAGAPDDEMAALERQLAPSDDNDYSKKVNFVSGGVETRSAVDNDAVRTAANKEDIELPEEDDSEEDDKIEIAQRAVPATVFGDLANRVDINRVTKNERDENGDSAPMGALERIKRQRRE